MGEGGAGRDGAEASREDGRRAGGPPSSAGLPSPRVKPSRGRTDHPQRVLRSPRSCERLTTLRDLRPLRFPGHIADVSNSLRCIAVMCRGRPSVPRLANGRWVADREKNSHSPGFSGKGCHCSAKPSGGEDLDIEEPVACRDSPAFHLHPTLPGMLGPPLIWDQVVQVRQAREKRLLAATWVMKAFHGEQFPLDGVMRLIQERAGHWHPGVCEDRIPARLLVLEPAPDALSIGRSCRGGNMIGKAA